MKIAFIGAGSFLFTRGLVRDILSYPAFQDCTIALMDLNEERLAYIKEAVDRMVAFGGYGAIYNRPRRGTERRKRRCLHRYVRRCAGLAA